MKKWVCLRKRPGIFWGLLVIGFWQCTAPAPTSEFSYLEDVQPILAAKCYACHGPDGAKREANLRLDNKNDYFKLLKSGNTVVDKGDLSNSEIIKRITSDDPDFVMPPPEFSKQLEPAEIQIIQNWVESGLEWENHWALDPIKEQMPPRIDHSEWSQNPIDAFIWAEHKKRGLQHAPPADKRTLVRRLYFDLHGLPPSPEAVERFVHNADPKAYEKLVDTLLGSPRYGERWARHWLDVVHYGETHGYDKDKRRLNAWPYRDYVIEALNKDIPYSRFVEDQIAGDILYPDHPQSTVALGFLAAGPWDLVGHAELREGTKDKRIVRNLDRDDIVTNVMSSFTSLTVQCARCHDHKFDPISQEDYYSLQAVFAGVDRADRIYDKDPGVHKKRRQLIADKKALQQKLDNFNQYLTDKEIRQIDQLTVQQNKQKAAIQRLQFPSSSNYGFHSKVEKSPDLVKWVQVDLKKVHELEEIILTPAYPAEGLVMPGYGFPLRFKLETATYSDFSNASTLIDYSEEDHHERTDKPLHFKIPKARGRYIRLTANKLWKGRGTDYFFALAELQVFSKGRNVARHKAVHASDYISQKKWKPGFLTDGFNSRSLIQGAVLPPKDQYALRREKARLADLENKEQSIRRSVLPEAEKAGMDTSRLELDLIEEAIALLPNPEWVYAVASSYKRYGSFAPPDSIRPVFLLNRGDTEQPLSEVQPGTVSSLMDLDSRFDLSREQPEGARRAALARWLTHEKNNFTWRSIVNRIWQYHFGNGLVQTANDFGKMGAVPSHRALLDYLASAFLENGQSLKWLHKLMVTSAAYRQQSVHQEKNHQIDSDNRYLWKANRRQLEAEAIRDAVLTVNGNLDLTPGGPSFDNFRYEDDHSPRYWYKDYNTYDPASYRRAIYRSIIRSVPDPFMTTLDCANPSQSVPVRGETITALQALSLLNNPFMVRQADFFAQKLKEENPNLKTQLTKAYALAFQRLPEEKEFTQLMTYAEKHGLSASCRLIFAMNEFLYID